MSIWMALVGWSVAQAAPAKPEGTLRTSLSGTLFDLELIQDGTTVSFGVLGGPATYRVGYLLTNASEIGGTVELDISNVGVQFDLGAYYHHNFRFNDHLAYLGGGASAQIASIDGTTATRFGLSAEGGFKFFVIRNGSLDLGGVVEPALVGDAGFSLAAFRIAVVAGASVWIPVKKRR